MRKRDVERVRGELNRLRERIDTLNMNAAAEGTVPSLDGNYERGRDVAAVWRASMDLTRALAMLRRG